MMPGSVHQINVSHGGVPKLPVTEVFVSTTGVSGDRQADRKHHGGPDQTVCLYSLEVIRGLQSEGHPIAPGCAGENLTLEGLDWAQVVTGTRLRTGAALLEVTYPATPCYKNGQWFLGRRIERMSHVEHPGWSRMYARVLEEGRVATGDPVVMSTREE